MLKLQGPRRARRTSAFVTSLCFALLLFAASLVNAGETLKLSGSTMGTYYAIVIDSATLSDDGAQLHEAIKQRLAQINQQMSTWDPRSQISEFNRSRSSDWFEVDADFAKVAAEAKRIHDLTDGAFDPTVSPLIDLWGFGDDRRKEVPSAEAIDAALADVGMSLIDVRNDPPALRKSNPSVQLNLSAIAKGYGVDAIAELLKAQGQTSFIVDIGGENRSGQPKSDGRKWRTGVESPFGGFHKIVSFSESSIATSGDYRNFFKVDGKRYSHAISPTTGWPVENPPASITVLHESCMTADAWATALMVLGDDKGMALAEEQQLDVMFLYADGKTLRESSSGILKATPVYAGSDPASAVWFPFVAAAVLFLIAIAGMGIGVLIKKRELKGSCGGLASMPGNDGKSICDLCTIPQEECSNPEYREQLQTHES